MNSAVGDQLSFVFANDNETALAILEYLEKEDLTDLACLNKLFYGNITALYPQYLERYKANAIEAEEKEDKVNSDPEPSAKKSQKPKKAKKPKDGNVIKTIDGAKVTRFNLFEQKTLKPLLENTWTRLPFETIQESLSKGLKEKFIKEQSNVFFQTAKKDKLLIASRCLLDNSLNIENFIEKNAEESKYEELYQSEKFTRESYDFTDMSQLLERQKRFLQALKDQKDQETVNKESKVSVEALSKVKKVGIILCQGGYFALAVYDQNKCVLHKSDHKYVVRKKAGQRQISRDSNSGSQIKSMGSQIRRDQERKHQENIRTILQDAYKLLEAVDLILYHAPGFNKFLIMDKGEPMFPLRNKFRSLCLTTKRANYSEIERVAGAIFKVYLIEQ